MLIGLLIERILKGESYCALLKEVRWPREPRGSRFAEEFSEGFQLPLIRKHRVGMPRLRGLRSHKRFADSTDVRMPRLRGILCEQSISIHQLLHESRTLAYGMNRWWPKLLCCCCLSQWKSSWLPDPAKVLSSSQLYQHITRGLIWSICSTKTTCS